MAMTKKPCLFTPENPSKYMGAASSIRPRSSWEMSFMRRLDQHSAVRRWSFEPFAIPYKNPVWPDRISQYTPDFLVQYVVDDKAVVEIIEIKPMRQSAFTVHTSDGDRVSIIVNHAKWVAAREFAAQRGATFRVLTMQSGDQIAAADARGLITEKGRGRRPF